MIYNKKMEGLRGILMLWIVLFHYTTMYNCNFDRNFCFPIEFNSGGTIGVTMFFVISGYFMVSKILIGGGIFSTFINRYWRLYKSYILAIVLIVVWMLFMPLPGRATSLSEILCNMAFISHPGISYIDGAHWYIAVLVEIQLLLSLSNVIHSAERRLVIVVVTFFILQTALMCYIRFVCSLPLEAYWFGYGLQGMSLGICFKCFERNMLFKIIAVALSLWLVHLNYLYVIYLAIFIMAVYPFKSKAAQIIDILLGNPFLVYIGSISYAWYLVHQNIGYCLMYYLIPTGTSNMLWLFIPVGFTFILSMIIDYITKMLPNFRINHD